MAVAGQASANLFKDKASGSPWLERAGTLQRKSGTSPAMQSVTEVARLLVMLRCTRNLLVYSSHASRFGTSGTRRPKTNKKGGLACFTSSMS